MKRNNSQITQISSYERKINIQSINIIRLQMLKGEEERAKEKGEVIDSLRELKEAKIEDLRKALNFEVSGKTIGRYLSYSDQAEKVDDRSWRYRDVDKN